MDKIIRNFNDVLNSSNPIMCEHLNKFEQFLEKLLSKTNNKRNDQINKYAPI